MGWPLGCRDIRECVLFFVLRSHGPATQRRVARILHPYFPPQAPMRTARLLLCTSIATLAAPALCIANANAAEQIVRHRDPAHMTEPWHVSSRR